MNWQSKLPVLLFTLHLCMYGQSQNNPTIQTKYTADPAPLVHDDTVYLYTGHDEDNAEGFKMQDWLLYTSTDMVNWTDCKNDAPATANFKQGESVQAYLPQGADWYNFWTNEKHIGGQEIT